MSQKIYEEPEELNDKDKNIMRKRLHRWFLVNCFFFLQEHKVLLTGTPLQNTVEELFSLLHFLEPGRFPSETTFMQEFGDLKTEEQVILLMHFFFSCLKRLF